MDIIYIQTFYVRKKSNMAPCQSITKTENTLIRKSIMCFWYLCQRYCKRYEIDHSEEFLFLVCKVILLNYNVKQQICRYFV